MFRFTAISSNKKTGPIPTTMTEKSSCPETCPFRKMGCYGESGPVNLWWDKCNLEASELLKRVKSIPYDSLWRHNVVGDLIHKKGMIDKDFLENLTQANKGRKGFTYTHHLPFKGDNLRLLTRANAQGFTVNLSANSRNEAIQYKTTGLPVCVVLETSKNNFVYKGIQFLRCPAEYREKLTCARCGLCQKLARKCIIVFTPHGTGKKKAIKALANYPA